jgi:hypothetical protein
VIDHQRLLRPLRGLAAYEAKTALVPNHSVILFNSESVVPLELSIFSSSFGFRRVSVFFSLLLNRGVLLLLTVVRVVARTAPIAFAVSRSLEVAERL